MEEFYLSFCLPIVCLSVYSSLLVPWGPLWPDNKTIYPFTAQIAYIFQEPWGALFQVILYFWIKFILMY